MRKILIIGGSGAGKSTLARQLGDILHIPVYHLDSIFWKPGWQSIERDDLISEQRKIVQNNTWIIDGNYSTTIDIRLNEADTVIFLHYKTIRCLYGVVKRRIQYHGKTRPDMGQDCPEKLDFEFLQWVYQFNKKKTSNIYKKLNQLHNITTHIFTNPKQTRDFLTNLKQ
ncbi:DNA topology modulation protein [Virgibacillus ndiopensis]|uniref:DNA topology modulation protein n=1 Tax=Virgibacillus ndiopensis TaxID=2004408 RepID=UPI000C070041|nr:DNA topology modulation protein [Virgibacillus ndiopensis]